ncbi:MAG: mechanosensitive ion channel family protein [Acidobacteriota bacterium]
MDTLRSWLADAGLIESHASWIATGLAIAGVLALAVAVNFIARRVILSLVARIARRTRTQWDDALVRHKVLARCSHLAPALLLWGLAPLVFSDSAMLVDVVRRGIQVYLLAIGWLVASAFLNAAHDIYTTFRVARRFPIRGYLQLFKIVLGLTVGVLALSITLNRSPWVFLSGMGALTAIILLVFKDTILGFVAGMQLVANDMIRPGDWIEMPRYGADGEVQDVTLTTVKVRNWDKTVTTVPTYALISDSFKNWRGMEESGGRRIKRSIYLDVNSIKHCSPEMIERFLRIDLITDYVRNRLDEIEADNQRRSADTSLLINGRHMTNIGTFRAYVLAYLRQHPQIHQEMTFLVRQIAPTERGLPLEIYVFSRDQRWANYEEIQADIFDHLYASLSFFDLRPFQLPTGADLAHALPGAAAAPGSGANG